MSIMLSLRKRSAERIVMLLVERLRKEGLSEREMVKRLTTLVLTGQVDFGTSQPKSFQDVRTGNVSRSVPKSYLDGITAKDYHGS